MGKKLVLYVEGEKAVSFFYPNEVADVDFVQQIVYAASRHPLIVEITDLNRFPVIKMQYKDGEFIEEVEKGLLFVDHSNLTGLKCFAYVVNGSVEAIHKIPEGELPWVFAMQSSPTFEVLDV
jgi:hypothetical protein